MAKKTKSESAVVEEVIGTLDVAVEENMNKEIEETIEKPVLKKANKEPLNDDDEIEVISLTPNVGYKDSKTGDFYKWEEVGHIELMTFETIKNMHRNYKSYFRSLWLKPLDDRAINKLGLESTYAKYEFLMDKDNYTRENIKKLSDAISSTPNGVKYSICDKIKNFVATGEVSDIKVIRELETKLDLDLVSLLD